MKEPSPSVTYPPDNWLTRAAEKATERLLATPPDHFSPVVRKYVDNLRSARPKLRLVRDGET